jgi:hypothetical protein
MPQVFFRIILKLSLLGVLIYTLYVLQTSYRYEALKFTSTSALLSAVQNQTNFAFVIAVRPGRNRRQIPVSCNAFICSYLPNVQITFSVDDVQLWGTV